MSAVPGQTFPHEPQLNRSDWTLRQKLLQNADPAGHVHTPAAHSWPPVQKFPHEPQLNRSLEVIRQIPPQYWPLHWHRPSAHSSFRAQPWPQAPQLFASIWRLVHPPLQDVSGNAQAEAQVPLLQT